MMALFDQEKAVEQFGYEKMQEGREIGHKEGLEEGRIRQAKKTAVNMLKDGESMDKIARLLEVPADTIRTWVKKSDVLVQPGRLIPDTAVPSHSSPAILSSKLR